MHASTEQLVATASHLSSIADKINARQRVVRDDVEALVGAKWKGIAPRTHQDLWQSWEDGYVEVVEALQEMAHKITAAAEQFTSTDDANATSVSAPGSGLLNMDLT